MKHNLASKTDKKPTISSKEIEKFMGEDYIFLLNDELELYYPEFKTMVSYYPTRDGKTWYGNKTLPIMPEVGKPLDLEVKLFHRLLHYNLSPIRDWAVRRELIEQGNPETQFVKLLEEVGELSQSILKKNRMEFSDAIGDIVIVLTNLAAMQGMNIEDCINLAYNEIKDRTGSMKNGTFVKNK
jgi:NTP pyrophosphatase (non-canonical NTP hydrolase)